MCGVPNSEEALASRWCCSVTIPSCYCIQYFTLKFLHKPSQSENNGGRLWEKSLAVVCILHGIVFGVASAWAWSVMDYWAIYKKLTVIDHVGKTERLRIHTLCNNTQCKHGKEYYLSSKVSVSNIRIDTEDRSKIETNVKTKKTDFCVIIDKSK